ncbi:arginine-tRNA-protein transferase [Gamsiella multidivaricata]|uniref:arginine-tRNA-protein transferase n=1 Tax=Gamsiella multidivaricata TaxID=101098 RepID=UPI00221E9EE5|nr:arginine-tRNA-protein transferase [Gamsiella multidivaricata]KAG0369224.1 Arginyl-tRNA--protein transferase 1 [Gamsiella multidivaricata]KAI7828969.1 arginine-tRNA-protein transferase [Gamsiella multidivaricata]
MLLSDFSVITPYGSNVSSCGYCKSTMGSRTYGMGAHLMTCEDYQKLIDRGWRRSGTYLYKPNLRDSCCPQYTIRMKAHEFAPSKHQRQIVNRFNNYVQEGDENFEKDIASRLEQSSETKDASALNTEVASTSLTKSVPETTASNDAAPSTSEGQGKKQKPRKAPKNAASDLKTRIRSSEYLLSPEITSWKHRLRVKLEPSSFTEEKHALYVRYQMEIHHEPRTKCQASNFKNFLVQSPLTATKASDSTEEDPGFGSFHQCYYLDEKLIAVSVIDILPSCVSAVYFFYDPDYSVLSLGKYSAQREIALVQALSAKPGYENLKYYYMGFYIFTCPKMTYKGHFHPSYLLDPETYNWVDFKKCQEILKDQRYSAFENPTTTDPLFEAMIQSIVNKKKGSITTSYDSDDDDDSDDWEDTEDDEGDKNGSLESADEEDEEADLDPDEFDDKALESSDNEHTADDSRDESERKRTRLTAHTEENTAEAADAEAASEAKAARRKKKSQIKKAFRTTTSLPPPGCLDPAKITEADLIGVLCLTSKTVLRPVVLTDSYRNFGDVKEAVAEYYSYVGEELANKMILHIR